ncbi:hypothetical protein BLNAU_2057 [Blattamonas nauphoetae]|uniref:Uncharacterized protein n=1 Tax=Blattamonas nauphoetae TaxID=2049346 RepID=A0ABQ9YHH3_9EUKA|nr:hypothetical protein BLNAU_2057 [Blattamonas nauphoetae]
MFTNEHPISDDDILPTASTFFRAVRVSERPIPSFPRIRDESNEHPRIDSETDSPRDGNDDVSTTPRIDPTSFHSLLFAITTDDSLPDSSNGDPEITIALVHGDTSILLEDIVSMLLETIASLDVPFSFFWNLPLAEVSISENWIDFKDSDEFVNENMQFPKSCFLPSSEFQFTSDSDEVISDVFKSPFSIDGSPESSIDLCAISMLSPIVGKVQVGAQKSGEAIRLFGVKEFTIDTCITELERGLSEPDAVVTTQVWRNLPTLLRDCDVVKEGNKFKIDKLIQLTVQILNGCLRNDISIDNRHLLHSSLSALATSPTLPPVIRVGLDQCLAPLNSLKDDQFVLISTDEFN